MEKTNKILNATKECFSLPSDKELADFFGVNHYEMELIRNGERALSIENKLTILNFLIGADEYNMHLFHKIESGYLFNSLCNLYSLTDFSVGIDWSSDACFIDALRRVVANDHTNFHKETKEANICEFLGAKQSDIQEIENGAKCLDSISKLRILSWVESVEYLKENPDPNQKRISPFDTCPNEEIISSDSWLLNLLITECLAKESEEPMANQINDSVVLNAFKENVGLKNESDLALLVDSTATKVELINRNEETLSIDERIAIILRVIGKDHLQNCITDTYLRSRIMGLGRKRDESLSAIDNFKKYKGWHDKEILSYFGIKEEELSAIRQNKINIDDLPAQCRLKIFSETENIPIKEIELAIKSNSYLLMLIDAYKGDQAADANEKPDTKENNPYPYKPEGLNRLFWLAAKNIAVPDPDFGAKDNVLFAMVLHSGSKLKDIRMNDMVDAVIFALGEHYRHAGTNEINLANLLKHFRSDYALPIINDCKSLIKITEAIVKSGVTIAN